MRYLFAAVAIFFALSARAADLPKFKAQEIDTGLKRGTCRAQNSMARLARSRETNERPVVAAP